MVEPISAELSCEPVGLAIALIVAGHLVDSSPLSTIGALCVAGARLDQERDRQRLFTTTLIWGLMMAVVGAVWNLVFYGLLR
jgi:uncharacterized membrane protein